MRHLKSWMALLLAVLMMTGIFAAEASATETTETPAQTAAEQTVAPGETAPGTAPEAPADTKTETAPGTAPEAPADTKTETAPGTAPEAPADTKTETAPGTAPEAPADTKTEAAPGTAPEAPADTKTEAAPGTAPEAPADTKTEATPGTAPEAPADTKTGAPATPTAPAAPAAPAEPAAPVQTFPLPVAAGTRVKKTGKAVIDYSNVQDGYVMAQYTAKTDKRLKAQVKGPKTTYTYNVTPGKWEVFPLSDGNGTYQVVLYENVVSTKYAAVTSVSFTAALKDEFAPYLRPNQYVDYAASTATLAKAKELIGTETDILKKVNKVYAFVVSNLTYDRQKAATVQSGYLPVLDSVLAAKKGICFDYAALMTGMLRSQGVPCKLVVGYAGTAYHAWISVWSEATGWVDAAIYFNGTTWHRMDPTFASSANKSASIMKYIGDGANYTVKYLY